jgi:GNAT superfamily N-acetyltransferase
MEDMDGVIEVGLDFIKDTILEDFNLDKLQNLYAGCINHGCIVVAEEGGKIVGALAAAYDEYQFGDDLIANELFWYVTPDNRGCGKQLFHKFEEECKADGCSSIIMVAYNNQHRRLVERFYINNVYKLLETHYIKVF